jgi:hypothetical protein
MTFENRSHPLWRARRLHLHRVSMIRFHHPVAWCRAGVQSHSSMLHSESPFMSVLAVNRRTERTHSQPYVTSMLLPGVAPVLLFLLSSLGIGLDRGENAAGVEHDVLPRAGNRRCRDGGGEGQKARTSIWMCCPRIHHQRFPGFGQGCSQFVDLTTPTGPEREVGCDCTRG